MACLPPVCIRHSADGSTLHPTTEPAEALLSGIHSASPDMLFGTVRRAEGRSKGSRDKRLEARSLCDGGSISPSLRPPWPGVHLKRLNVRMWHFSAVPAAPTNVRFQGVISTDRRNTF